MLSLLLAVLFVQPSHAERSLSFSLVAPFIALEPLELSASDREWLDDRPALRVGVVTVDYEPVDITSDRNRYQGISADYLSLVGSRLNVRMQVRGFPRPEGAINALREGTIDIIATANNFERGYNDLRLSAGYMADRSVVVGRNVGRELTEELKGAKVVVLDGYQDLLAVRAAYPQSEIIIAPSLFSAMEAVSHGEADAFIGNDVIVRSYMALRPYMGLQVHFNSLLPQDSFSFAVHSDQAQLLSLLDTALASLGSSITREILGRWTLGLGTDASSQRIALSRAERRWIGRHPVVTVASEQHPPYIYRDKDGQWVGLNVDILNRISRITGLRFKHEEASNIEHTFDLLRSGQAQMNTSLAENTERREMLDFSYSFGGNSWVFVLRAGEASLHSLRDLAGRTLALPARHALEGIIRREHPRINLILTANYEEARQLVASGDAVATIQNEAGAYLDPRGVLKVGRSVEGWWSPDRMSVIKSQPELLSILNKALEEFPVSEMRAIRTKWMASAVQQTSLLSRIPGWVYWGLSIALSLGLVSLIWNSRLKAQIHQRLKAEEALNDQLVFKHALFDGIPNPVYVRDLKGRLISCNRSYEENLGISFEQMNGRRLIDVELIPRETAEQLHGDYIKLLETRQPIFADRSMQLGDKQIDALHWTVPFYRADGEVQGLLGGWIDISERKRLETQLYEAKEQAGAVSDAKKLFMKDVGHEMRRNLEVIVGFLELELEEALHKGQTPSNSVEVALVSARSVLEMIDVSDEAA
ncbi:transporter substrate-binding domain-containing protein [Pseudomonas sp. CDFA 550]|nr:transporter substrate-binding domain-containing protein [Pseudomonas quasicaspiana]